MQCVGAQRVLPRVRARLLGDPGQEMYAPIISDIASCQSGSRRARCAAQSVELEGPSHLAGAGRQAPGATISGANGMVRIPRGQTRDRATIKHLCMEEGEGR